MIRFLINHRKGVKIIIVFLALLFTLPPFKAFAAGTVSFSAGRVESKPDRLVEVSFCAAGDGKLSAALFTFDYDAAILSFRKVKTPDGSQTVFNDSRGSVKISYLCSDGADISRKSEIFTLVFMAESTGSCDLSFNVSDCVDSDVRQMNIGECTSGRITVLESGSSGSDKKSSSRVSNKQSGASASNSEKKTSKSGKSSSNKSETETGAEVENLGTISKVTQTEPDILTPVIILCASGVICAAFIGFLIYKIVISRKKPKNPQNKNGDENSVENL